MTAGGTVWFKLGFVGLTSAYIFGMLFYINKTKRKKQIKKVDELIADLEELRDSMSGVERGE